MLPLNDSLLPGEKDLDNNNERTAADGYQLVSYDDAKWDELLDSLTFDEMVDLVNNGAFQTAYVPRKANGAS